MINEETYKQLVEMKLHAMAASFRDYLDAPQTDALTFEERFGLMIDREWSERQERRLQYRLRNSKLREEACVEDIDYTHPRNLDKSVMQRLSACKWIKSHDNVIFTGKTGLGKTWLACALSHKACQMGYHALYVRVPRLLQDIYISRGDGSYPKVMQKLAKPDILILDDFGISTFNDNERRDFLEVIEDRQGRRSTIVTSQLKVKHWHEVIAEPTIADAILDRLTSRAHRVELEGKSLRTKMNK